MPPTALAIRHLDFEDLGLLHPVLLDQAYTVRYLDVATAPIDADAVHDANLLIVLGGPIGANDTDRYPLLSEELAALRNHLETGKPTLGICLGAQLLARALGADVTRGDKAEIGYAPLTLTPHGLESPLRHLADVPVLHWHHDQFDLPAGAVHLASTPHCPHQAFTRGDHVLGLQFHPETDHRQLEPWLIGHAEALATAGIHPDTLRRAAATGGPELSRAATQTITDWLDGIPAERLRGEAQ